MEQTKTLEDCHLEASSSLLRRVVGKRRQSDEARVQLLEAAASKIGGFSLAAYHELIGVDRVAGMDLEDGATKLLAEIAKTPLPPALALAALARPPQDEVEQKRSGSWNTDWRLANLLASGFELPLAGRLLDPACGTGALLVAAAMRQSGGDARVRTKFLADGVCGTDLDGRALRGAALALSSLTSDIGAIRGLLGRLRKADALVAPEQTWHDATVAGRPRFESIVGNPPWERMRITRHEHLAASGLATHYGDVTPDSRVRRAGELGALRAGLSVYLATVSPEYGLQGGGDADLYKLFTELALRLLDDGGQLSWLLPGGIIRSQGSGELRKWLLEKCPSLRMTVFSNIGRFFSVYRRQKFVLLEARVGKGTKRPLELRHGDGKPDALAVGSSIPLRRDALLDLRADLAVPEVRSRFGWNLYLHLARSGSRVQDWRPEFLREVDMSLDRRWFTKRPSNGSVGIIEGRMVHQYRHDAKRYHSGTGRAARWIATPETSACAPTGQYWIPTSKLSTGARMRMEKERVGFCDVTGQTNERGMLCAPIPAGYVCGNKVPTILFEGHRHPGTVGYAFVAIANSFAFDWVLRRMISTTVNYFLLRELPWPALEPDSLPVHRLAELARRLSGCSHLHSTPAGAAEREELRLAIELLVAEVWNIDLRAMREIFDDFPLLDGGAPPLPGERRSTITRDLVLLHLGRREGINGRELRQLGDRVEQARVLGAVAFTPTQFANAPDCAERAAV